MSLTNKPFLLLLYVLSCLMTDCSRAQVCHELSTYRNPGELLCNGYSDLLHFKANFSTHNITEISFSKNNITTVDEVSFEGDLSTVLSIFLDNNSITTINPNAFIKLPNLEQIDLSGNNITFLDTKVFIVNKNLRFIDLTGNDIEMLDIATIKHLNNLKQMILSDNPLNVCNKRTAKTLRYLRKRRVEIDFLQSCDSLNDETIDEDIDTNEEFPDILINKPYENNLYAVVISVIILGLLTIIISMVVIILCLRIYKKKKVGRCESKRPRTLSGRHLLAEQNCLFEDKYGYLEPNNLPRHIIHQFGNVDKDGYLIPNPAKSIPKYLQVIDPTHKSNSSDNLINMLSTTAIPNVPNSQVSKTARESVYSGNHVYEEILEPSNNFQRYNNLQRQ